MPLDNRDPAHLWDMLQAAREVEQMLDGYDLPAFLADIVIMRATERGIEIIGEAARHVSKTCRQSYNEIHWHEIIGQRNILAHEYGQIDHELLFRTAVEDIPDLIQKLEAILPPIVDE